MKKVKKSTKKTKKTSKKTKTSPKIIRTTQSKTKVKKSDPSLIQFNLGIALCVFSAILMFYNLMTLPLRIAIAIVGIFLIASAPFGPMRNVKN